MLYIGDKLIQKTTVGSKFYNEKEDSLYKKKKYEDWELN